MRCFMSAAVTSVALPFAACASGSGSSAPATASSAVHTREAEREKPIGYQLKRLDGLLEIAFERLLAEVPMSRRQWQTLNVIRREPSDDARLAEALRPFWEANHDNVADIVADLTARAWVQREPDGRYTLTPEGQRTHATAAERVSRVRTIVAEGISEPEFAQTLEVLARMITNLENATAASGR